MDKSQIALTILVVFLGMLVGAVAGVVLDKFLGMGFFSKELLQTPWFLQFYVIKVELQLTPASLLGIVVSAYFALKKG